MQEYSETSQKGREMNTIIEPCCYPKQLTYNLEEAERGGGVSHFFSYSDWSTDEIIPWAFSSVPGCEAVICLVQIDPRTIYMIADLLRRTYRDRKEGKDRYVVGHLTIITQPSRTEPEKQRHEFRAQLGRYMDDGRVTVCEDNIGFRCIAAGNGERHLVIQGSFNQFRVEPCCQMYSMTTSHVAYEQVMDVFRSKSRIKKLQL